MLLHTFIRHFCVKGLSVFSASNKDVFSLIRSVPEHEIDRAAEAEGGPEVVEPEGLFHVEEGERDEDHKGDHFLHDLELAELELRVADAVGGHLQQVFEQGDAPARERGDEPGPAAQVLQVRVPCEGHEDVGEDEQEGCLENDRHICTLVDSMMKCADPKYPARPRDSYNALWRGLQAVGGTGDRARRCRGDG